ncbi:MAG: hypothetical protein HLUCCO18_08045 [Rhodobacteraceae bacterium HLUCCO18]|nr:MAG: hypothetical protein HLUCCO18_08045 [Rhodobacteraceae bacterium HLUCCO18]
MLSIFTLTVMGAFGASNVLTDVTERSDRNDDENDDGLEDDLHVDGLGGDEDLIERLDMYAALGMTPAPVTPTSEAYLPAEEPAEIAEDNVFDYVDDAVVADLTPEEFDLLSRDMAAAQTESFDDGEPTEVISVAVGGPGAVTPNPTEAGFRTQLGPDDELTLNIAPDLPGDILAVHSVFDLNGDDESSVGLRYALSFYMLPPGQVLTEDNVTGSEAGFMEAHGLQKLGEIDLGRFEAHFDEKSGETVVTDDSRQVQPPHILSNRAVTEIAALFS